MQVVSLAALAQEIRLGEEFQVNTYTTHHQTAPSVAAANGIFVVAWQSYGQDGSYNGVFARRFSSAGTALATEFLVNTYTSSFQVLPSVAAGAAGDFVVVWGSVQDGASYGVFARRFTSAGVALASEFQVNTYTTSHQYVPSVAAGANGDFVIAWQSYFEDGSYFGVFARRFSSSGVAMASEFQVNTYTTERQTSPSVAAAANGDFVVAWTSYFQDQDNDGVFARRFSSSGVALADEFQVSTYTTARQRSASVAAGASGDFVVAWTSNQDGGLYGVFARRFSSAGIALASEFQVNVYTTNYQGLPSVAVGTAGDFVITWSSYFGQDGANTGVFARRFSSAGVALASEFQVNTFTPGYQALPSVAGAGRDFVVTWKSLGQDGSNNGVFAQRFRSSSILDIDGDGNVAALTDGLLVLRYLFGFTGPTLTAGAVAGGCSRCDAAVIQTYLATLV